MLLNNILSKIRKYNKVYFGVIIMIEENICLVFIAEDKRIKNEKIIGSSIGVSILLLLSFVIFHFWKRKQKRSITIQTPIGKSTAFISFIFTSIFDN